MDQLLQLKRCLLLLLLCTGLCISASAQIIKGTVADKQTGEPLIGSTVTIKSANGEKQSLSVGLDGTFTCRNIAPGKYEVEAKYISYKDQSVSVEVGMGELPPVQL